MSRIIELDALRGIALFGILMVNIFVFHAPLCYYGEFYGAFEGLQILTVDIVVDFFVGKFLFIFAFLFGYGIVLQQNTHQKNFRGFFIRRMGVLLVFGLLHILLFWLGDILASYAVLGLVALPFVQLSDGKILFFGSCFVLFRPLYYIGAVTLDWPMINPEQPAELEVFKSTFQNGTYFEIFTLRMKEFAAFMPENLVWYIPKSFGLFLLGIYACRQNLFSCIKKNQIKSIIISVLLVVSSFAWHSLRMDFFKSIDLTEDPYWRPALIGLNVLFETAMGIGYLIGFSVLFQKKNLLTTLLSNTGRLALTNYIFQSLACVLIFYGYGLGYYMKLNPTDLIWISVAIFGFNVLFSNWYLKFYSQGPLEFLWRRFNFKIKSD